MKATRAFGSPNGSVTRPGRAAAWALIAGLFVSPGSAAAQVPPDEAWRTLETEHFRITFPEHLGDLAARTGVVAEQAHEALSAGFRAGPGGAIDIVLTDHVDVSNGYARYSPSNRIVLYARPPPDHLALGYFDDWLEQLIVHELAHVFHLDYTGWFGRFFRALFGRLPSFLTFPGTNVPGWVIEGLATWYESALTPGGRVHGTYHEMVLRTAALEGRFESLGTAGGYSPQWPGGGRRYVYGSLFFEYLLDKHGRDVMAEFVEDLARNASLPGRVLDDVSLTSEWDAWREEMRARVERLDDELAAFGPVTEPEALTSGARQALHPAVSPDGGRLVYVRSDGRSDPRLVAMPPAGGDASTLARTNHLTRFDFLPDGGIVFSQREFTDRYRHYSDLYVLAGGGTVRRVTEGARVAAPSAGPDGGWAVAVMDGGGTNGLVRVDLGNGALEEIVAPAEDTYWAWPAVSPDGRWIVASRWAEGRHDVVILDADGRPVHAVTRDRALDMAPAWTADGRHLVWSSDRTGIPNVLATEIDPRTGAAGPPRLLTNVRTGAAFPRVDPAGEWLYFSGYHVDGWEIERVPFAPDRAPTAPEPAARFDDGAHAVAMPGGAVADHAPATAFTANATGATPATAADDAPAVATADTAPDDAPATAAPNPLQAASTLQAGTLQTAASTRQAANTRQAGTRQAGTRQTAASTRQAANTLQAASTQAGTRQAGTRQTAASTRQAANTLQAASTQAGTLQAGTFQPTGTLQVGTLQAGTLQAGTLRNDAPAVTTAPPAVATALETAAPAAQNADAGAERGPSRADDAVRGYSPFSTLRPTYWFPDIRPPVAVAETTVGDVEVPRTEVLGFAFGGRTEGFDVVGRHAYAVGAGVFATGEREGDVSYEYRGLGNPTIGLAASQTWGHDGVRVSEEAGAEGSPETFFVLARRRRVAASLGIRRPGYRTFVGVTFSAGLVRSDREVIDADLQASSGYRLARPGATSSELSVALDASTARSHAFQMGNARGAAIHLRARTRRDLDVPAGLADMTDADRSADDLVGRFRAYLPLPGPGFAAPVLAVRASAGAARGPATRAGYFSAGGNAGLFAVRGHDSAARAGRRAWSASVEFRAPLALINRGAGTWGLHLDRLFISAFADAGDARGAGAAFAPAAAPGSRPLTSFGIELTTDLLALLYAPLRLRFGLAAVPDPDAPPGASTEDPRWRRVFYVGAGVPF